MATGACGIDCSVCRLHVSGICSTCGSGTSDTGKEKLAAQYRLLGEGCPVLLCAVEQGIGYCLRDCDEFPCEKLRQGTYPFSHGYLAMHQRRRRQIGSLPAASWPETASRFWDVLTRRNPREVCRCAGAKQEADGTYGLQCLNETWFVDPLKKQIIKAHGDFGGEWDRQIPFLMLVYLAMAKPDPPGDSMIAPRDVLPGKNFFEGRYELKTQDVKQAFDSSAARFLEAAKKLGGVPEEGGDVSARFRVFPKIILHYLIWLKDEEFPSNVIILFNENLPAHYPLDATAVLINLLSQRLVFTAGHLA